MENLLNRVVAFAAQKHAWDYSTIAEALHAELGGAWNKNTVCRRVDY